MKLRDFGAAVLVRRSLSKTLVFENLRGGAEFFSARRKCHHSRIEPAMLDNRGHVTRAVQNADDHDGLGGRRVIDRVGMMESHAEPRRELGARRSRQRKIPKRLARCFDRLHEAGGGFGGGFGCEVEPDFGEVVFGRVGQVEGERSANNFLPR